MKVKNEYVEIKNGDKTYIRKNMILDRYIKNLFSSQTTTDPTGLLLGDVDLSGTIDVTDLSTLSLSLVDKKELTGQSFKNADVTQDGKVDLTDLATLRQYLSKKITKF